MSYWHGINDFQDLVLLFMLLGAACGLILDGLCRFRAWYKRRESTRAVMMPQGRYDVVVRSTHHGKEGAILTFRVKGDM